MAENGPFHEVEELLSGDLALCPGVADASALTLEPAPASQPRPFVVRTVQEESGAPHVRFCDVSVFCV